MLLSLLPLLLLLLLLDIATSSQTNFFATLCYFEYCYHSSYVLLLSKLNNPSLFQPPCMRVFFRLLIFFSLTSEPPLNLQYASWDGIKGTLYLIPDKAETLIFFLIKALYYFLGFSPSYFATCCCTLWEEVRSEMFMRTYSYLYLFNENNFKPNEKYV